MSKRKLLLADDSITIQKVVNLTFADEGIEVVAVGSGDLAIERLSEISPDLVMADVHMPGLNGYQVCDRIRQNPHFKDIPVILLVGSFEPFDENEARRVGANDYLTKPFQSIRLLVNKVAVLLSAKKAEAATANMPNEAVAHRESIIAPISFTEPFEHPNASDSLATFQAAGPVDEKEFHIPYDTTSLDDEMIETSKVADDSVSTESFQQTMEMPEVGSGVIENEARFEEIDYAKTTPLSMDEIKGFEFNPATNVEHESVISPTFESSPSEFDSEDLLGIAGEPSVSYEPIQTMEEIHQPPITGEVLGVFDDSNPALLGEETQKLGSMDFAEESSALLANQSGDVSDWSTLSPSEESSKPPMEEEVHLPEKNYEESLPPLGEHSSLLELDSLAPIAAPILISDEEPLLDLQVDHEHEHQKSHIDDSVETLGEVETGKTDHHHAELTELLETDEQGQDRKAEYLDQEFSSVDDEPNDKFAPADDFEVREDLNADASMMSVTETVANEPRTFEPIREDATDVNDFELVPTGHLENEGDDLLSLEEVNHEASTGEHQPNVLDDEIALDSNTSLIEKDFNSVAEGEESFATLNSTELRGTDSFSTPLESNQSMSFVPVITDSSVNDSEGEVKPQVSESHFSDDLVEEIVRRVLQRLSDKVVREVAWDVVPEMAETIIKRLAEEKMKSL